VNNARPPQPRPTSDAKLHREHAVSFETNVADDDLIAAVLPGRSSMMVGQALPQRAESRVALGSQPISRTSCPAAPSCKRD